MNTKLHHFTTLFRIKKKKAKHQPHSATLTYSDRLLKITSTKLVNTQFTTPFLIFQSRKIRWVRYICSGMKLLVKKHVVKLLTMC